MVRTAGPVVIAGSIGFSSLWTSPSAPSGLSLHGYCSMLAKRSLSSSRKFSCSFWSSFFLFWLKVRSVPYFSFNYFCFVVWRTRCSCKPAQYRQSKIGRGSGDEETYLLAGLFALAIRFGLTCLGVARGGFCSVGGITILISSRLASD